MDPGNPALPRPAETKPASDTTSQSLLALMQGFRPYVNPNDIQTFDERDDLEDRKLWWEHFCNTAEFGRYTPPEKCKQLRGKLWCSVRAWYDQLGESTHDDWESLAKLFYTEYCRSTASAYDPYHRMTQKPGETPRQFLYRLNAGAKKARIDYSSSRTKRRQQLRMFLRGLAENRLQNSLQCNSYESVEDMEDTLRQIEEVETGLKTSSVSSGHRAGDSRPRGFSGSPSPKSSMRTSESRPHGVRAYLTRGDESDDEASESRSARVRFMDQPGPDVSELGLDPGPDLELAWQGYSDEEIYRAAAQQTAPLRNRGPPVSPRGTPPRGRDRPDHRTQTCSKCGKAGHEPSTCWADLVCGRCGSQGHPTQFCRRRPCEGCGQFHDHGKRELWRDVEELRRLLRAGGGQDLPEAIRARLPGEQLNE